jgi:hypothetical protein
MSPGFDDRSLAAVFIAAMVNAILGGILAATWWIIFRRSVKRRPEDS